MPHTTWWSCQSCGRTLGQVGRDGCLEVRHGGHVKVPAATEAAGLVVIVVCAGCATPRRWTPRGYETKAG